MDDLRERLLEYAATMPKPPLGALNVPQVFEEAAAALEAKDAEIYGWRECALYDACMDGPKFKGWDRSALDRMRRKAEEAIKATPYGKEAK